ncbi:glycoside hydrolase family 3 C-terminal domain-containing protein [uncultured Eubacterium sp.]|uniref:glycoside hydrolase family 3 C-terminal domain-containing protein n=1 Tax=uncultured Eubacterium sp. TaxID=165185 RepID=UPI0015AF0149|nr:glycoside hydrolase family 3 C-terminal domain-containing protein [uncultured Eubacterium sp.]
MKHSEIVGKMSLEQKAAFVSGNDYWHLEESEELGLPRICITDGPHGLRKAKGKDYVPEEGEAKSSSGIGLGNSVPTTCFPPAATSSCSWDEDLLFEEGVAMGEECLKEKVSVILGPGTNIKRAPTCGRNFEYFSEDPLLAGKCSAAVINGVQSKGVGTSLKHFACNSQEAFRMVLNEVIDERTMREIYFPAFEIAVKEAQPWTVMNSYNRINGVYASQNEWMQQQVLRKEWGFEGLIVTDWGASVDRVDGVKAGTDLEMPTSGKLNAKKIIAAVQDGTLDESILDERVDAVVDLILKSKPALAQKHTYDKKEHHKIAQRIAEGSMVLLKNEDNILPLQAGQKIAVIGEMAKAPRFQGAGSSVINPTMLSNAYDELVGLGVDVTYAQGYYKSAGSKKEQKTRMSEAELTAEAVKAAKNADVAVVFVGLTEDYEGEGYDRETINMPPNHNKLVSDVAAANPNTVVVLAGGSVVLMPWLGEVKALLNSGLGGQAGGAAVANLLTGKVNPSGKTSETYPTSFEVNPTFGNYPGGPVTSEHKESVYIGYRYYDSADIDVVFPFGYGLSYTTFEYSDIKLSASSIKDTDSVDVSFKIKNTGSVGGAEIAQVYVCDKESTIFRPKKELKAFTKVFLNAGEEKEVTLTLSKRAFAFYNVNISDWCVESGEFDILVGASSRDIKLNATVNVEAPACEIPDYRETAPAYYNNVAGITRNDFAAVYGELPNPEIDKNKRIDKYCCLNDARHTRWGGRLCKFITKVMSGLGSAENGDGAMLAAMATQIPIRNFVQMSMGAFSEGQAKGLLMMLNDDQSSFLGFSRIFWTLGGTLARLPKLLSSI